MKHDWQPSFKRIIGTGGLGIGSIYQIEGDQPLGKSESRKAFLQDQNDYCKLQIILHYVSVLIAEIGKKVEVYPVSAVGADANGKVILTMLQEAGMSLDFVETIENSPTLTCVCLNYPDGSSSNITEGQSACEKMDLKLVKNLNTLLDHDSIFISAAEVPVEFRLSLLDTAKRKGSYTIASYISGELRTLKLEQVLNCDLLILNYDETIALLQTSPNTKIDSLLEMISEKLADYLKANSFIFTNGSEGVYCFSGANISKFTPHAIISSNTAGAGDAFLSGVLFGMLKGLPLAKPYQENAIGWGLLFARISVESNDTIALDFGLNRLKETIQALEISGYEI